MWFGREEEPHCYRRLWRIGNALLLYQKENNGALPKDLDALVSKGDVKPADLYCPKRDGGPKKYRFFAGGRKLSEIGAREIVAADPVGAHQSGGNVLLGDGSTVWLNGAEFQSIGSASTLP
jgi:hypothetical protein